MNECIYCGEITTGDNLVCDDCKDAASYERDRDEEEMMYNNESDF